MYEITFWLKLFHNVYVTLKIQDQQQQKKRKNQRSHGLRKLFHRTIIDIIPPKDLFSNVIGVHYINPSDTGSTESIYLFNFERLTPPLHYKYNDSYQTRREDCRRHNDPTE